MPVSQTRNKPEAVSFQLTESLPYPFSDLDAERQIQVEKVWKTDEFFWLRLKDPQTGLNFDFRILKIYRNPDASYLAIVPARRWDLRRSLQKACLLKIQDANTLLSQTAEETQSFSDSLMLEESKQLIESPEYNQIMAEQLAYSFGKLGSWQNHDMDELLFEHRFILGKELSPENQEFDLDLEVTKQDPGFIRLKSNSRDFRILAFFENNKQNYIVFELSADLNEGLEKSQAFVIQLVSREKIRILSKEEFESLCPRILDAIEKQY